MKTRRVPNSRTKQRRANKITSYDSLSMSLVIILLLVTGGCGRFFLDWLTILSSDFRRDGGTSELVGERIGLDGGDGKRC